MINHRAHERLRQLVTSSKQYIVFGGDYDEPDKVNIEWKIFLFKEKGVTHLISLVLIDKPSTFLPHSSTSERMRRSLRVPLSWLTKFLALYFLPFSFLTLITVPPTFFDFFFCLNRIFDSYLIYFFSRQTFGTLLLYN